MKKWKVIKDAPLYVKEKELKSGSIEIEITFSSEPVDGYTITSEKTYKDGEWIDRIFKKGDIIFSEDKGKLKYPYTTSKFNLNDYPDFFEFLTNKIEETEEKCDECGKVCCTTNEIGEGRIHTCYAIYNEEPWNMNSKILGILCVNCHESKGKDYESKYGYATYCGGRGCG